MREFVLPERLEADTVFIADWPLCRVLLMNDARYPWLVLVPRRAETAEIFELDIQDRALLIEETARAARALKPYAAKINIGALGNLVPQLHVHVVARNVGDAAWPGPVWGQGRPVAYAPGDLEARRSQLVKTL